MWGELLLLSVCGGGAVCETVTMRFEADSAIVTRDVTWAWQRRNGNFLVRFGAL